MGTCDDLSRNVCPAEHTAPFVPLRQETVSKPHCLSTAWLGAAGTGLLAFPSGQSPGLVNPQLFSDHLDHLWHTEVLSSYFLKPEQGGARLSCTPLARGSWSALLLLPQSSESPGAGAELCKKQKLMLI